jgi:hypothetical protein
MLIEEFLVKVEEWMDRSEGRIRADVVPTSWWRWGSPAPSAPPAGWSPQRGRRGGPGTGGWFRPWVPEPGLWLPFDWGDGPKIAGRKTLLSARGWPGHGSAWWSRPGTGRCPTLLGWLDTTLRRLGGARTYALTDNEKTVTVEHIARVPIRHPDVVAAGRYYGMTIRTCVPADPQSKGGAEATVRIAKADLVPPRWQAQGSPYREPSSDGPRAAR